MTEHPETPDVQGDEEIALGGNIQLTGFSALDRPNMVVVKKMVGNYARKISEACKDFQELHVTLKTVHETEKSEKYEIHARVIDKGTLHSAEVTDRNLFFAIDNLLKKILKSIGVS
ncbi:MAG: hypothetical protein ABIC95_07225 [archaeon]